MVKKHIYVTGNNIICIKYQMFLNLKHTELDVFQVTKKVVLACYKVTTPFPSEERYGMVSQIRRAALSVHLNVSEGCSRKSLKERKRFFEISRGSLIEVDTAFDIAHELNYTTKENLTDFGILIIRSFQLLSKLIG